MKDRHSTTSSNPRLREFGPWTEQYSSSGKRYFYNRETEVSQWEKPVEWREYEKSLADNTTSHSPISSSSGARAAAASSSVNYSSYAQQRQQPQPQYVTQTSTTPSSNLIYDDPSKSGNLRKTKSNRDVLAQQYAQQQQQQQIQQPHTQVHPQPQPHHHPSQAQPQMQAQPQPQPQMHPQLQQAQPQPSRNKRPAPDVDEDDMIGPVIFNEEQHRRFFRPDLVSYIRRWPSEEYEQSAWKADGIIHNLTLQILNVSCDLKCARSLVKTAEMRSSLLSQKLTFLADHQRQLEATFALPSLPSASTTF
ncbi:unnamed protein product [Anisakis simplex]|uniref:WW domain-containing protein n=1 Tax=Anisakis simplex TaxID=6269 RepID=A0A3P6NHK1_ANISI|nr:unnamed protein product [Anisakis simplex]